jgi:basic amino acid/polyamine antiporter, APA family
MAVDKKDGGKIGLGAAVLVGINAMIGAGILTIPTQLSAVVGPAGICSCLFAILAILFLGLSLGRAAEIFPGQGWNYLYPSKWAGHAVGLFSALTYVLGILLAMGLLIQQSGVWMGQALSSFIPDLSPKLLSIIILSLLSLIIIAGAQASTWGQYIVTILKIPLVLTALFCWLYFDPKLVTPFMPNGIGSVFSATPIILFGFFGFEAIACLYPIVKDPGKNIPKAYVISILTAGAIYAVFYYGILFAIPKEFFSAGLSDTLSNVLNKFFPNYQFLSKFVLIGGLFAMIGTVHSVVWSVSELLTSILRLTKSNFVNGLVDKNIWNSKVSVIACALIILTAFLSIDVKTFIPLAGVLIVPSYVLSVAALFFVKSEWRLGRNIITLFGFLGGLVMFYFAFQEIITSFFK